MKNLSYLYPKGQTYLTKHCLFLNCYAVSTTTLQLHIHDLPENSFENEIAVMA